jgi:hypothetical protein
MPSSPPASFFRRRIARGSASHRALALGAAIALFAALALSAAGALAATSLPQIRTSVENRVPRCVTPARLMAFLKQRNRNLDPRLEPIAEFYKRHGEFWRVRWDYAFFQMAVETNFLTYRQGNGRWGDVNPKQNNFAGLGTTGGGVPGDSYPDVSTGVLAQIQHLVVYSGQRIPAPVGARTKLKQDDIIETMAHLNGRTTFADLSRRWAADRHYGAAIEWVAASYRTAFCNRNDIEPDPVVAPAPKRVSKTAPRTAHLAKPMHVSEAGLPPPEPLGGPPATTVAAADTMPVRTIWSRDHKRAHAAQNPPATTEALPQKAAAPGTSGQSAQPAKDVTAAGQPADEPETQPAADNKVAAGNNDQKPAPQSSPSTEAPASGGTPAPAGTAPAPAAPASPPAQTPAPSTPAGPSELTQGTPASGTGPGPAPGPQFAYAGAMDLKSIAAAPAPAPEAVAGGSGSKSCRVLQASYGGTKTFLVQAKKAGETQLTAVTVLAGFERSMLDNYVKAHAPGGASVGEFASKEAALAKANELCAGTGAKAAKPANAG